MGARESEAMGKARHMVMVDGLTPYEAAKRTGLTRSAIYMSGWYKEWRGTCKKK